MDNSDKIILSVPTIVPLVGLVFSCLGFAGRLIFVCYFGNARLGFGFGLLGLGFLR